MLARATLADLLVRAEGEGDLGLIRDLQALSLQARRERRRALPQGLRGRARGDRLARPARRHRGAAAARLRPAAGRRRRGDRRGNARRSISTCWTAIAAANRAWGTATGLHGCDVIAAWLARRRRRAGGERWPISPASCSPRPASRARPRPDCSRRRPIMRRWPRGSPNAAGRPDPVPGPPRWSRRSAAGLRAGQAFALAYADAKRAAGAVDFDDLIARGGATAADARHGRLGALQARPADRPYPGRRGAGHQRAAVEHRPRAGRRIFRRRRARRGGTARSSPSATTSRRSSASRAPTRQSFDVARAWFAREARGDRARLPRSVDGPELPLVAADPRGRSTG